MFSASGHIALTIGIDGGALEAHRVAAHLCVNRPAMHAAATSAIPVASFFFISSTMASRQVR
ncbi:Uncharacterised protein [Mycobacteroides abscessus subsp. abscessus]|nr:Uncharacterised protein [Mycobacteroides abscessus subsp. abscessus]